MEIRSTGIGLGFAMLNGQSSSRIDHHLLYVEGTDKAISDHHLARPGDPNCCGGYKLAILPDLHLYGCYLRGRVLLRK